MVEKQDAGNDQCVRRDAAPGAEEGVSVDRAAETCSDGASGAAKSSAEMETKVGHARARHDSLAACRSSPVVSRCKGKTMSMFEWKANFASALILIALVQPEFSFAQTRTSFPQLDQRVSCAASFGAASLSEDHGPLVYIWQAIREQLVVDDEAVSACLRDGVPDCAPVATLLQIIGEAKAHRGEAL